MKTPKILYILIGCVLATSASVEAYGRRSSGCVEPSRANDGKHGSPGYLDDGEDGEDGKIGKNGQGGGHGGNGGVSVYGNGGNGGNGGDAD
jgi:hypothetical protein